LTTVGDRVGFASIRGAEVAEGYPGSVRFSARAVVGLAVTVLLVAATAAPSTGQTTQTPGLSEARQKANDAAAEMNRLESELGELDGEITRAEAEAEAAEAQMAALDEELRALALQRYTDVGVDSYLTDPDPTRRGRAKVFFAVVTGDNADALDEYRANKAQFDRAGETLAARRADQQETVADLAAARGRLDAQLAQLERQEADRVAAEQRRQAEEARVAAEAEAKRAAEVAAEQAAAASTTSGPTRPGATTTTTSTARQPGATTTTTAPGGGGGGPIATGAWVCPVQGARSFIDSWGFPRPGGRRHQGTDIMSPRGTPVVIPVAGSVSLRTNGIGGLSFHLNGNDGNYYYGTHMDSYANISAGSYPAGTVVGYVGDTGDAKGTGTHLHFEIHPGGGAAVDPYPTVAQYC